MILAGPRTSNLTRLSAVGTTRPSASTISTTAWTTSRPSATRDALSGVSLTAAGSPVVAISSVATTRPARMPTALTVPGS